MAVDIDEMLDHLGQFGKYQKILYLISCITAFFCAQPVVMLSFVSYLPDYRCLIKGCDDPDNPTYDGDFLNFTIPEDPDSDDHELDKCKMYLRLPNVTRSFLSRLLSATNQLTDSCTPTEFDTSVKVDCKNWVYDHQEYDINSLVEEFELTCSNEWLGPLGGSSYMVGMLIGAVSIGAISDKFGRKPGFIVSLLLMAGGGLVSALSVNNIMFLIMRFITGIGAVGLFQVAFIIAIEFVGPKYRTFCGILINVPFALGEASVGVLAIFITSWRWLIVAICVPSLLVLILFWYLPESFRWLLAQGHKEKALTVIKKAAEVNKTTLPEEMMKEFQSYKPEEESTNETSSATIIDLFKTPNMRLRTLNQFFIWMVCTCAYYGLSSNSGNLGGDIYVNFIATMLIEIPSYIFTYFVVDRMGRKGTLSFVMLLGGISCIGCGAVPSDSNLDWLAVTLSLVGKFGISAAFSIIYMYSAELFPTNYRSLGVGACSTCARIGGIISPFVAGLGTVFAPLPFLIFGSLSIVAGCLVIFLPETVGAQLPETLQQSEEFGTDQGILYFTCFQKKKERD